MIMKLLISVIFVAAAFQKFSGKVAPDWERWGFSRRMMYATGSTELAALVLFWVPGLQFVGAIGLALVLLGALVTLLRNREGLGHIAFTTATLLLIAVQSYRSMIA